MSSTPSLNRSSIQPVRKLPLDPPDGLRAIIIGQIAVLIANLVIQLFTLWAAIDAFARQEYTQVTGLSIFSGVLFSISLAVLWLGRRKEK